MLSLHQWQCHTPACRHGNLSISNGTLWYLAGVFVNSSSAIHVQCAPIYLGSSSVMCSGDTSMSRSARDHSSQTQLFTVTGSHAELLVGPMVGGWVCVVVVGGGDPQACTCIYSKPRKSWAYCCTKALAMSGSHQVVKSHLKFGPGLGLTGPQQQHSFRLYPVNTLSCCASRTARIVSQQTTKGERGADSSLHITSTVTAFSYNNASCYGISFFAPGSRSGHCAGAFRCGQQLVLVIQTLGGQAQCRNCNLITL